MKKTLCTIFATAFCVATFATSETRVWLAKVGNLPTQTNLTNTDYRAETFGVSNVNWVCNNVSKTIDTYTSFSLPQSGDWSFGVNLFVESKDFTMVDKSTFYLVIKFRNTDRKSTLNISLNGEIYTGFSNQRYDVNVSAMTGDWQLLCVPLSSISSISGISGAVNSYPIGFHANDAQGGRIDIDYIYFTNNPTNPQINEKELGLYKKTNLTMYNPSGNLPDIASGAKDSLDLYVVSLGDYVCFKQITSHNAFDGTENWRNQICLLESNASSQRGNAPRTYKTSSSLEAGGNCHNFLFGCTDSPIKLNAYAKMWGGNGYYSEIFDFRRGYNNTPSDDVVPPTFNAVGTYDESTQTATITFSNPSEQVFYYIVNKSTNIPQITIEDTFAVSNITESTTIQVQAVDFNGNFSEPILIKLLDCGSCFQVTF